MRNYFVYMMMLVRLVEDGMMATIGTRGATARSDPKHTRTVSDGATGHLRRPDEDRPRPPSIALPPPPPPPPLPTDEPFFPTTTGHGSSGVWVSQYSSNATEAMISSACAIVSFCRPMGCTSASGGRKEGWGVGVGTPSSAINDR